MVVFVVVVVGPVEPIAAAACLANNAADSLSYLLLCRPAGKLIVVGGRIERADRGLYLVDGTHAVIWLQEEEEPSECRKPLVSSFVAGVVLGEGSKFC